MGRHLSVLLALSLTIGCTEYTFPEANERVWGEPNPAEPENVVRTDRLLQVIEPTVDILWVVDNSGSMTDDREALADNFPLFVEPFEDASVDWHVGVITTDPAHDGVLIERQGVRWVDADTLAPADVFTEMATTARQSLNGVESGRQTAYEALGEQAEIANSGFRRPGAYLHLTVVTDEDDDTMPPGMGGVGKDEFVDFIDTLTEPGRNSFNSIVALSSNYPEERGQKYIDLSERLGGLVLDINGGDWGGMLGQLGGTQAPPPTDEFFLSAIPVPETIEVTVVWQGITWIYVPEVDYIYDRQRNSVQFQASMPPQGSAVQVDYTVAAAVVE